MIPYETSKAVALNFSSRWFCWDYLSCALLKNITLSLTLSWRRPFSYRNQSIDSLCKSMDWFLYDNDLRHERVTYCSCIEKCTLLTFPERRTLRSETIFGIWKPFKKDEKCFLFHLKVACVAKTKLFFHELILL